MLKGSSVDLPQQVAWCWLWCQAFPTLLPTGLYDDDVSGLNNEDEDKTNDHWFKPLLVPLALEQILLWNHPADRAGDHNNKARGDTHPSNENRTAVTNNHDDTVKSDDVLMGNKSLGYGEITPKTVTELMLLCRHHAMIETSGRRNYRLESVVDLGSGSGRVLLAACLSLSTVRRAVGLELVPALHQQAMSHLASYNDARSLADLMSTDIHFFCCDFTAPHAEEWIRDADIMIVHGTVFDQELHGWIQQMAESPLCQSGTFFCMVTHPLSLSSKKTSSSGYQYANSGHHEIMFETLVTQQMAMDWGHATVFIQRKL
eukprot:scaffold215150_cov50-Attheya_sp.AAC.1